MPSLPLTNIFQFTFNAQNIHDKEDDDEMNKMHFCINVVLENYLKLYGPINVRGQTALNTNIIASCIRILYIM